MAETQLLGSEIRENAGRVDANDENGDEATLS